MDKEGLVVAREEVKKIYLPPANEATFSIDLPESLKAGDYTLVLTFDLGEGDSLVKEVDFNKSSTGSFKILAQRD